QSTFVLPASSYTVEAQLATEDQLLTKSVVVTVVTGETTPITIELGRDESLRFVNIDAAIRIHDDDSGDPCNPFDCNPHENFSGQWVAGCNVDPDHPVDVVGTPFTHCLDSEVEFEVTATCELVADNAVRVTFEARIWDHNACDREELEGTDLVSVIIPADGDMITQVRADTNDGGFGIADVTLSNRVRF